MSYRAFKRLLGETSLERKCRFLFGTATQRGDLSNIGPAGVFALAASNDSSRSQVMPTVELEIGAEYHRAIGRAQRGANYRQILAWYYSGAAPEEIY